jgi:hypothetical protein
MCGWGFWDCADGSKKQADFSPVSRLNHLTEAELFQSNACSNQRSDLGIRRERFFTKLILSLTFE